MQERTPISEDTASLELASCDLSALAPQDFRHWISNAVVQCMATTDAGPKIDRHKLGDLVERHFDRLVDGNQMNFAPVFRALCRIKGVSEAALYIGVVNLQQRLACLNIEMAMPDMKLDQWTRAQLLREAHEATEQAREEREQSRLRGAVQELDRAKLGALLVQERLIDESELAQALELQQANGGRLGSHLVQLGFLSEADLARFLGRQLGLPSVTEIKHIPPEARRSVPHEILLKHRLVPLAIDARELQVAMVDPTDLVSIDELAFVADRRVRPVVAPELVVDFARARFFGIRRPPKLLSTQAAPEDGPPAWPRSVLDRGPVVLPAPDEEPYDLAELAHELLSCEVEEDIVGPPVAPVYRPLSSRRRVHSGRRTHQRPPFARQPQSRRRVRQSPSRRRPSPGLGRGPRGESAVHGPVWGANRQSVAQRSVGRVGHRIGLAATDQKHRRGRCRLDARPRTAARAARDVVARGRIHGHTRDDDDGRCSPGFAAGADGRAAYAASRQYRGENKVSPAP